MTALFAADTAERPTATNGEGEPTSTELPPELLAQIRRIEIRARRIASTSDSRQP